MKINKNTLIGDTNYTLNDLVNDDIDLKTITNQFTNAKYSGATTSAKSFSIAQGVYLAVLWINAGSIILPALYVVTMNSSGGGAVCCGSSANANLSVCGTTVTVNAPYGNVVFYSLTKINNG